MVPVSVSDGAGKGGALRPVKGDSVEKAVFAVPEIPECQVGDGLPPEDELPKISFETVFVDARRKVADFGVRVPVVVPVGLWAEEIRHPDPAECCVWVLFEHRCNGFEKTGMEHIVRVDERDEPSAAPGKGRIPGGADARVCLMDRMKPHVLRGEFVQDSSAFVRAAVVDADAFPVLESLLANRVQAFS